MGWWFCRTHVNSSLPVYGMFLSSEHARTMRKIRYRIYSVTTIRKKIFIPCKENIDL